MNKKMKYVFRKHFHSLNIDELDDYVACLETEVFEMENF